MKAVTKHCAPCASQRLSHCCGHEPRGVATHTGREAQPLWGYSFGEQPPGPQHSSRRSDTKQAAPRPTRACLLGAEYLLEAESLSVDRVGQLSGRLAGRFRLLCTPETRPPQGLAQAFQRREGQKWEEQRGQRS